MRKDALEMLLQDEVKQAPNFQYFFRKYKDCDEKLNGEIDDLSNSKWYSRLSLILIRINWQMMIMSCFMS